MNNLSQKLKDALRDVPDFPKEGIIFKDITPIFKDPNLCKSLAEAMVEEFRNQKINAVAGIESRGFLLGPMMATILGVPFIMVRKKGKLPWKKKSIKYALEYGEAEIEMHIDSINNGDNVLIHDDLLATGGTAKAAAQLINELGGKVAGFSFLVELSFLKGRKTLQPHSPKIFNIADF